MNRFFTLFWCFQYWLWTSKYWLTNTSNLQAVGNQIWDSNKMRNTQLFDRLFKDLFVNKMSFSLSKEGVSPAGTYLFKVNNGKVRTNLFKVYSKDRTSMNSLWRHWYCCGVSTVDFEETNAGSVETMLPGNTYLIKVNNRNTTRRWNMFKVNNKNTRTTPMSLTFCR